jgi:hypothetical protein
MPEGGDECAVEELQYVDVARRRNRMRGRQTLYMVEMVHR